MHPYHYLLTRLYYFTHVVTGHAFHDEMTSGAKLLPDSYSTAVINSHYLAACKILWHDMQYEQIGNTAQYLVPCCFTLHELLLNMEMMAVHQHFSMHPYSIAWISLLFLPCICSSCRCHPSSSKILVFHF